MSSPTQAQADAYITFMARHFGATVVTKRKSLDMQLVAAGFAALRALGKSVPSPDDFLDNYSTTIGTTIYMGSPSESFPPEAQMEVVTHECMHVVQYQSGGHGLPDGIGMMWLYLVDSGARARFEVEAYRAAAELRFAMSKKVEAPQDILGPLEDSYELDRDALRLAHDLLEIGLKTVSTGLVSTVTARVGIEWIRQNARELLA